MLLGCTEISFSSHSNDMLNVAFVSLDLWDKSLLWHLAGAFALPDFCRLIDMLPVRPPVLSSPLAASKHLQEYKGEGRLDAISNMSLVSPARLQWMFIHVTKPRHNLAQLATAARERPQLTKGRRVCKQGQQCLDGDA